MIDPAWVSGLAAILFIIGLWGAFSRKNAIVVLMCIELMLNAVNLQFVAAANHHGDVTGWVYAIFAVAIAAAEVTITIEYVGAASGISMPLFPGDIEFRSVFFLLIFFQIE